jgi:hypothetical protein
MNRSSLRVLVSLLLLALVPLPSLAADRGPLLQRGFLVAVCDRVWDVLTAAVDLPRRAATAEESPSDTAANKLPAPPPAPEPNSDLGSTMDPDG